jgi:hypothetical protein
MSDTATVTVHVSEIHPRRIDETGTTIADARRFAKCAERIFVHYDNGAKSSGCFMISRSAFLKAIKNHEATELMKTRLYETASRQLWLQVG